MPIRGRIPNNSRPPVHHSARCRNSNLCSRGFLLSCLFDRVWQINFVCFSFQFLDFVFGCFESHCNLKIIEALILEVANDLDSPVQLAELYAAKKQPDAARAELKDVLSDDPHAPAYQRKRDRVWIRRAKSLMGKL